MNFCTSILKRKEIPKIGKNGTKLTLKSFNSKLAPSKMRSHMTSAAEREGVSKC